MFFFSSRRRHTRCLSDWSSDVCSSVLDANILGNCPGNNASRHFIIGGKYFEIGRASCREREEMLVVAVWVLRNPNTLRSSRTRKLLGMATALLCGAKSSEVAIT